MPPLAYYRTVKRLADDAGIRLEPVRPTSRVPWWAQLTRQAFSVQRSANAVERIASSASPPTLDGNDVERFSPNAERPTPNATRYPHLANYIHLLEESAALLPSALASELDRLYEETAARLATTPEAQALVRLAKEAQILRGLLDVKLSRKEWAYYRQHQRSEEHTSELQSQFHL